MNQLIAHYQGEISAVTCDGFPVFADCSTRSRDRADAFILLATEGMTQSANVASCMSGLSYKWAKVALKIYGDSQ